MGFGWSNDVETDYGRVQNLMTEEILELDTFRICVVGRRRRFALFDIAVTRVDVRARDKVNK
jgi:hypothetical protein